MNILIYFSKERDKSTLYSEMQRRMNVKKVKKKFVQKVKTG